MTTRTIYKIKLFLLLILINGVSIAEEANVEDARNLIKKTAEQVISRVSQNREELESDPGKLYELVNSNIVPHIDLTRMSRWILGKHWRKATHAQKEQFVEEFRKILIRTYSSALVKLTNEEIAYPPMKKSAKKNRVTVRSEVILPDGKRFSIDYRVHSKDKEKGWLVYDISVNGVSLIATYRSSFKTEIRKVGLDGLLLNMQNKNKELSI